MNTIEAQGLRLIVDNSSFETLPEQDPFTPRVPGEEIRVQSAQPVRPVVVDEPAVPVPPPPGEELPPRPPVEKVQPPEEPLPAINISGLVWNTNRPQAIIDGHIVEVGDIVSGVKIVDIQKSGITVLFHERTEVLEIKH